MMDKYIKAFELIWLQGSRMGGTTFGLLNRKLMPLDSTVLIQDQDVVLVTKHAQERFGVK